MNRISALIFSALLTAGLSLSGAEAAGDAKHPEAVDWSFNGLFGTYDRDSLRRGYKVYTEVSEMARTGTIHVELEIWMS